MDNYLQILTKYWGYTKFRPLQERIIRSIDSGNDTLGLMPTGGGKSITFQVPTMVKQGLCLVITPLISLMKDQVDQLNKIGIKAYAIHSGLTNDEIIVILDNCIYGDYKFLYISPERIGSTLFKEKVKNLPLSIITVDEAHCISQWGYDFRPSYLKIAEIRDYFPDVPVLAITATATPKVIDDIQDKLKFRKKNVLRTSFERKNLVYLVRNTDDKNGYIINILKKIQGSGIIYVRSRKKTKNLSNLLNNNNISANYYHAGLKNEIRNLRQTNWKEDKTRVMVATNAFGMGIDKPNVRYVIHYDLPDSIEAYFQEAGRAGRDEKKAYAVLLFNKSDILQSNKRIKNSFPEIHDIKNIYQALGNYLQIPIGGGKNNVYEFNIANFSSTYNYNIIQAYNCLKLLENEGYIVLTEELDNKSRVHFTVNRDDLYKFQIANARFDGFIKLVLRSYTGLFSDYVIMDENTLAKRANITRNQVYEYLVKLSKFKIINYIPQKKTALIILLEERLDNKNIRISKENYLDKKQRYINRLNAVIDYTTSNNRCRSQQLMDYFGQIESNRCKHCDICTKKNELDISNYEFNEVLDNIKEILSNKPVDIDGLVNLLDFTIDKSVKVVQWLLDNNQIRYNERKELEWHDK